MKDHIWNPNQVPLGGFSIILALNHFVMADLYYRFKSVSVEQFATISEDLSDKMPMDYKTRFSFRFLKDENVLVSRADVILLQKNELKMKAIFDCSFEIKEESVVEATLGNGDVVIPRGLLVQLASLNYGTLRGIIIERTKGTPFSSVFLPPLIVEDIITEDLVVPDK